MTDPLRDPAQGHIDAIYDLISFLLERCSSTYDQDMDDRFGTLLSSFESFRSSLEPDEEKIDIRLDDSLGRNYLIAHAALMQMAINRLQTLALQRSDTEAKAVLDQLKQRIEECFARFFGHDTSP